MAGKYLTKEQRTKIEAYTRIKMNPCEIAKVMDLHHSTIYREIKKGIYPHNVEYETEWRYSAEIAQQKHELAQTSKGRPIKLGHDHELAAFLEQKIATEKFSPAAALGEIKRKNLNFDTQISITTLYTYIDKGYFLHLSNKNLLVKRHKKKQHYRQIFRSTNVLSPSIDDRPEDVALRDSFGNWEMDTVVSGIGYQATLLVLTERMTRKEILIKLPDKKTESVVKALNRLERKTANFKEIFQTITVDNGCEFADWCGIQKSINRGQRTKIYFCHPYSSWERGSNENCNKIIRRFMPKGCNIGKFTDKEIKTIENWINNYPRKIHQYLAAEDIYQACVGL